ncbi:trigger factor [Pseudoflavonifractor sp. DSM 107456]|uniref:Trigger factor n=2 Tax=Pseudoflavonifractor TaxID=1017280 RepID=A0ABR9R9K3_9FIRM|nr:MULTISPECIES: trigger factor [Eubacteriales]MBC5731023.1 trigger factor [Pseudoflavonifractor hominis]MBE5055365.1 trigger factor [Pseudoflavonifractor gallinarum]MBS5135942.1 trigger factor [Oscillospiraceae bacterium]MBT9684845.1 trigger factor [Pseudoflavonifractor sp. MCC625]
MNVKSVEKQEKSIVELVIEVSGEEFEAAIEKVYKKQRSKISVPGFRKGKAPRKIIEGMYGSGVFYEDAINEIYPEAYSQAVEQEKLDVVAWPQVEIQEVGKDGFTFKAKVTVRPEVKLGEYKGLTAEREEVTVTDEDLDNELKPYINRATRAVTVEREAKLGDTVVIDFEGFKDDVAFEGGKAEGFSLELGSGTFIPGFEDQLVGTKAGDEKDLNVTFPEDYQAEELAGAPVVFKVKVHEVKEKQLPTVDDEFAKDVSEFETLADLKKDLGDKLKARREDAAQHAFENALIEQVVENMEVEIPEAMVDAEAEKLVNNYAQRVTSQGIPFDQYLAMMGMTMEQMKEQAKESALKQVQSDLALGAIVDAEKIEVTDEEVEAEIKRLAEQYNMTEEQLKKVLIVEDLKRDLCRQKAAHVVFDSAKTGKAPAKKKTTKKKADAETEGEEKPKRTRKTTKKDEEKSEEKTEG